MNDLGLTVSAIVFIIPSVTTAVSAILPLQELMSLQIDTTGVKSETNSHRSPIINEKTHDNNNLDQQEDDNNDNNDNNCNSQHSNCSDSDSTAKMS